MHAWIQQTLSGEPFGPATLVAAHLLGLLGAATSCCTLPVLGAVAGYAGTLGDHRGRRDVVTMGLTFLLGSILALAALGALLGIAGHLAIAALGQAWKLVAGLLLVFFGLAGLGLVNIRVRWFRRELTTWPTSRVGAFLYGLGVGGGATACSVGCNPVLAAVLAAAAARGATATAAAVVTAFALGWSLPLAAGLVGLRLGLGRLGATARRVSAVIRVIAALVLVAVGFTLLATL